MGQRRAYEGVFAKRWDMDKRVLSRHKQQPPQPLTLEKYYPGHDFHSQYSLAGPVVRSTHVKSNYLGRYLPAALKMARVPVKNWLDKAIDKDWDPQNTFETDEVSTGPKHVGTAPGPLSELAANIETDSDLFSQSE